MSLTAFIILTLFKVFVFFVALCTSIAIGIWLSFRL